MYKVSDTVCKEYLQKFPHKGKGEIAAKNEDRIKFMLSHQLIRAKLNEWASHHKDVDTGESVSNGNIPVPCKAPEHSLEKKEAGNNLFKNKSFRQSVKCYNEAIRFAKFSLTDLEENENFALCLGNRSAAYYELGTPTDLQNSLDDTILALKYGYPDRLKIKLFLRQVNIYLKMGKFDEAQSSVSLACECPIVSKAEISRLDRAKTELKSLMNKRSDSVNSDVRKLDNVQTVEQNFPGFKENPQFEGASTSLTLRYCEDKSRYVKCNASVSFGDVVFLENPFASILIPEFYESNCFHCHRTLQNEYYFPCCQCSQVKFCSESCFLDSWSSYHRYECGFLDLLNSVGIAHLALKVVLVGGKEEILKILELNSNAHQLTSDTSIFRKGKSSYCRVFSLLDHIEEIQDEDLFQYSLTAGLLVNHLLQNTSYFDVGFDDEVYKIGGIILKHICQLICNAHAITCIATDLQNPNNSAVTAEESQVRIACAIYSSASMMNHSCEPNIASSFSQGRQLVVRVTKDLKKGSEVFNCYGPHARRMRREARQDALSQQYFFKCDCSSCIQEEEAGFSFVDKFQALKCTSCSGPVIPDVVKQSLLVECQDCGKFENVEQKIRAALLIDKLINLGTDLLDKGKPTEALTTLVEVYRLCQESLYKFHADFGHVCDLLGRCNATLEDFDEAVRYVKQSVEYVEERFGGSSIEYARSLSTLDELLRLSSPSQKETSSWIKSAKEKSDQILQLYINS